MYDRCQASLCTMEGCVEVSYPQAGDWWQSLHMVHGEGQHIRVRGPTEYICAEGMPGGQAMSGPGCTPGPLRRVWSVICGIHEMVLWLSYPSCLAPVFRGEVSANSANPRSREGPCDPQPAASSLPAGGGRGSHLPQPHGAVPWGHSVVLSLWQTCERNAVLHASWVYSSAMGRTASPTA